jgi:DNA repair protein RadA
MLTDEKQHELSEIKGLGPVMIEKLAGINILTVKEFGRATRRELEEIGIKEGARKMQEQAFALTGQKLFVTAAELAEERINANKLSTGSLELDAILHGGYESGSVTEIVGQFGSGKTQLGLTAAIIVQLSEMQGGLKANALILDTERSVTPERMVEIARCRGLDPAEAIKNVIIARARNSDHQDLIMSKANRIMQENNVKLLIVDSLIAHFRSEYLGREHLSERQQEINHHLSQISGLAEDFEAVAIFTNQMIATPDMMFSHVQEKPAGGNIIAHKAQLRLSLRKGPPPVRIARIIDSSFLPQTEAVFQITPRGVEDVPDKKKDAKDKPMEAA